MSTNDVYELLTATIQPRPIAFVSTLDRDGRPNLAPFSFFNAGGANPPSLVYSASLNSKGEPKDSLRNVRDTGEFVVNIVTRNMAEGMNATSFNFPAGFDEWSVSGFTPLPSEAVRPPRVAESPVHFECRLYQILPHGIGPGAACYVVGEIVVFHVAEWLLDEASELRPISRLGGPNYLDTASLETFTMPRPSGAPERRSLED